MSLTFETAVNACPILAGLHQPGLGALSRSYRRKIVKNPGTNIRGSVEVDKALESKYPSGSRWDYGIGYRDKSTSSHADDRVCWVEVHPAASSKNIKEVLAKLEFHRAWLKANASELDSLKGEYVWIATGTVGIQKHHRRELAASNITLQGKVHHL